MVETGEGLPTTLVLSDVRTTPYPVPAYFRTSIPVKIFLFLLSFFFFSEEKWKNTWANQNIEKCLTFRQNGKITFPTPPPPSPCALL